MKPLESAKGMLPLYAQIHDRLKADIENGVYRAGDNLPPEMELLETFGVSRITVRQAMQALEQEGLVVRARGKGTVVTGKRMIRENLRRIESFTNEMLQRGMEPGTRSVTVERIPADETLAEVLSCPTGMEVTHLTRVRTGNGKPIVLFESWLAPGTDLPLEEENYLGSLYALLEKLGAEPPVEVEEEFSAVLADEKVSQALDLLPGAPVMRRIRIGYDRKDCVQEYTIGWYDGSKYSYTITSGKTEREG